MKTIVSLVAALILPACSCARPTQDRYTVVEKDLVNILGQCDPANREIDLDVRLHGHRDISRLVAAHEIGHGLGILGPDMHDSNGWMRESLAFDDPLIERPTQREIAKVRATRPVVVVVDSRVSVGAKKSVLWAAQAWNRALKREAVVVEEP